jgi:hypothetical protein
MDAYKEVSVDEDSTAPPPPPPPPGPTHRRGGSQPGAILVGLDNAVASANTFRDTAARRT